MELKRMRLRRRNGNRGTDLPLPREIMMEILHRLPLKTLLTCKRVSKQWKEVITDPMFYKRHINRGGPAFVLGPEKDALSALFISEEEVFEFRRIPIGLKKLATYPGEPQLLTSGGSSSNGIVGVKSPNGNFLFHDLFTGGSFAVRSAPGSPWICHGFGYDSQADDYKILVVCDHYPDQVRRRVFYWSKVRRAVNWSSVQNADKSLFWVYSFHNKGWEQFQGFPAVARNGFRSQVAAQSLNGVLHWVVERSMIDSNPENVIVTYDLHTSRFGEMLPPPYNDSGERLNGVGKVSELNGLLWYCYTIDCGGETSFKYIAWVMNHYGLHDSWQKLATIDIDSSLATHIPLRPPGHLFVWDNVAPAALYTYHHQSSEFEQDGLLFYVLLFACHSSGNMFSYDSYDGRIRSVVDNSSTLY